MNDHFPPEDRQAKTILKHPPHSIEIEQTILAAILLNADALIEVQDILTPEMFYRREHRVIWESMIELNQNQAPVDVLTVHNYLKASSQLQEAGGIDYLEELVGMSMGASNIVHYATVIRDKALERQLIGIAHGIADNGYFGTEPVLEKLANAQTQLLSIMVGSTTETTIHIDQSLKDAFKEIDQRHLAGGGISGISTGFKDLDRTIGGLKKGEVVLVAGRPSSGKSTLAQNIIEFTALAGLNVLFFSVEMPERMVTTRHISSVGKIPLEDLISASIFDHSDTMLHVYNKLKGRFYHIDDSPGLLSTQILPRAQRIIMKTGKPLDLIVVDYMQKLRDQNPNTNARLEEISGNIKHTARVLNCPMIALSQLSRECEKRADKRPILSDLRDSGAIEQDADVILFVYRDEMYNKNSELAGTAEVIVGKNRNGKLGKIKLTSRLEIARFENFAGNNPPPTFSNTQPAEFTF